MKNLTYIYNRIFKPYPVSDFLIMLDSFRIEFGATEGFNIMAEQLKEDLYFNAKEWENHLGEKSIRHRLLEIVNVACRDHIASGAFHFWAGEILEIGPGDDLVNLAYSTLKELYKSKFISREEYNLCKVLIKEDISENG